MTPLPQGNPTKTIGFNSGVDIRLDVQQTSGSSTTLNESNNKWINVPTSIVEVNGQTQPVEVYSFSSDKSYNATPVWDNGRSSGWTEAAGRVS